MRERTVAEANAEIERKRQNYLAWKRKKNSERAAYQRANYNANPPAHRPDPKFRTRRRRD